MKWHWTNTNKEPSLSCSNTEAMEGDERDNSVVTEDTDNKNDDAKDREDAGASKTPQIQRSVAFDLSATQEDKQDSAPVRRVTIR